MSPDIVKMNLPESLLKDIAQYIDENYIDLSEMAWQCREVMIGTPKRKKLHSCSTMAMPQEADACAMPMETAQSLEDMLRQEDAGFSETLLRLIDQSGKKDAEVYKKAGITKQHFSKIRNKTDYRPTKPTAVALALALELDLEQTRDFIGRAGYALNNSSKFDLIVRYFIERGDYDLIEINMVLYRFDQPLLYNS